MPQTTTVVLQIAQNTFPNGTRSTAARAVPVDFDFVTIQINCTTGDPGQPFTGFGAPFSDQSMSLTFGIQWSWDGGATFPGSTQAMVNGSATGTWGTDKQGNPIMSPFVTLGIPFDSNRGGRPTTYRAYGQVGGGPISFGLTGLETTG
jgi:hypothetical protein